MRLTTRKMLDRSFTGLGVCSLLLMAGALVLLLGPIFVGGARAFLFKATVEHRRFVLDKFKRGDPAEIAREGAEAAQARRPVYEAITAYESSLGWGDSRKKQQLDDIKGMVRRILGPMPGEKKPVLLREQYGQTRWDRAQVELDGLLYVTEYDYSDPTRMGRPVRVPRINECRGTALEPLFTHMEQDLDKMLRPRTTFYGRFLFDSDHDAHFFGGIWPAVLGTLYLTVGAMFVAAPVGIISAIYLAEYAGEGRFVSLLRTCISTLAGVPSIVFGLFGLAFFLNTLHIPKSVLAGSLTLALVVLPTIIRASEEAIRAVPRTYKEAALSLGATKWRTIATVILPASLSGILTSIIISMGRAAGETAPIIFTAAVSVGQPLRPWETLSEPTSALPWNIYNLATEHQAVNEIRHVQYGMVLTLVLLVLVLNTTAIILRARVSKRLRG